MSLLKSTPRSLASRRNWVENFLSETDDFFKNRDWDMATDVPAVNVREDEKSFFIEVAAPGMKKEDFKIELDNFVLKISAKAEDFKDEKDNGYVRREFSYRNFQRSFWMPETIKMDDIKAQYEQGVLKLTVPKLNMPEHKKSKMIEIS